ncbi:oxidoreductase [Asticcacaulis excentricus]|uniref:Short-chain dehydrogenase/reductase SDR n=1 Tax=Asticcacaulis excentricus (strain ATCC 15261 / DSM 4724 / KCTC 12464 / NCIMB 9791 / VKM B-1370 / CB 48) TaxID=573065 RepID=E8RVE6_ASTEC|nr:oxidoreductase [Asticcacaulis excentricus]ADU15287.1 short-chain dehydrogenase/reductase SDR [Asticcacaulis excentricus CB 48]
MFNDKVIVITGASSGIGEATAHLLAQKGFRVFAGARRAPTSPPVPNLEFGVLDVTNDASVENFINWVLREAGRIDVLINNAGVSLVGPVEKTSIKEAQGLFDTNVFGPFRLMRAVLPTMREAGQGLIINISSVLGFLPAPFMGVYASSKHALEGLSESLDHEVREFNVRVVLVEPSFTKTNLDTNSAQVSEGFGAYESQVSATLKAVIAQIKSAPAPISVARKILSVITGPYKMREPADGTAKLLSRLRRFMPAGAVDRSLRKSFGLRT